ncbi:heat shock protein 23-like [Arctopsyche grandis]|uniref:heat shock protein 23-like n=1 Tax=Arctopsyche grandis TaxID=121162 RepID=UPI00406D72F6
MALLLLETPSHFMDQHLFCRRQPRKFLTTVSHTPSICKRHSHQVQKRVSSDVATSDNYEVQLDVKDFTPDEISVKIINRQVVVEAKTEKENEHVFESKHLIRKYTLPDGCKTEDVVTSLSSEGLLTVTAPRLKIEEQPKERLVPIKILSEAHRSKEVNTIAADSLQDDSDK